MAQLADDVSHTFAITAALPEHWSFELWRRDAMKRRGNHRATAAVAALALLLGAASALAQGPGKGGKAERAGVLAGLVDCRKLTEPTQRLACYDRATDELDRAEKSGEVTVIDRNQAKTLRKQAFGFDLPSLNLFVPGPKGEEVDRLTVTLDHAGIGRDGRWRMVTDDGAVWVQVDDEAPPRDPHKGSQLAVRKAALGSYFCNVDGQRAMRCQRQH